MRDEHAGDQLEVFHGQMAGAGVTGRTIVQLTWTGLHVGDEFFEVCRWHVRMNHENIRHFRQQCHRYKVFVDVIRLVFQHVRIDRQRAHMTEDDGVAIRRGSGDFLHGGNASTTGLVFNVDRLPKLLAQFCGH